MVETRERNNVVGEGGGGGGVGKKVDVRSRLDSAFWGGSEVSRYPGSSDGSPGDWHSYPSRTEEAEKAQP